MINQLIDAGYAFRDNNLNENQDDQSGNYMVRWFLSIQLKWRVFCAIMILFSIVFIVYFEEIMNLFKLHVDQNNYLTNEEFVDSDIIDNKDDSSINENDNYIDV